MRDRATISTTALIRRPERERERETDREREREREIETDRERETGICVRRSRER